MRPAPCLALLLATACAAAPASATTTPRVSSVAAATLIRGARVFDGVAFVDADVLIEGTRITRVEPQLRGAPDGARVIEGAGHTLLPGLVDAHTHAGEQRRTLEQALVLGVTLEIDLFGPPERLRASRIDEDAERFTGMADLRGAGTLATCPGGHGTEYGIPIPTLSTPEEADAFVAARFAEGSDLLKITYGHAPPLLPVVSEETLRALVAAAHARGRRALVHVETEADAIDAVEAGADGLAHLFFDRAASPELVAAMRERGTFVIATLTTTARACGEDGSGATLADDPELVPYLSEHDRARLRRTRDHDRRDPCFEPLAASIAALHHAGVPILAGTDAINAGTTHGASMHGELALLVRAGLSIPEALAAATSVPARVLELEGRGRIAPGMRADLVLVEGAVEADIHATRAIRLVMQRGHDVERRLVPDAP